jgi:hypothetical protein
MSPARSQPGAIPTGRTGHPVLAFVTLVPCWFLGCGAGSSGASGTGGRDAGERVDGASADAEGPEAASPDATGSDALPAIGDCKSLPAAGTVEDITPAAFGNPPNIEAWGLAVNPQSPNVVYLTGGNITNGPACPAGQTCPPTGTGVYVSQDCGATFSLLSTGPNAAFTTGDLWDIEIDPDSPQILYTMNGYGGPPTLFKSTDGGTTWTNLFTSSQFGKPDQGGTFQYGGFVRSFDMDPGDPTHLVVAFHEDCYGPVATNSSDAVNGAVMCLAESHDSGATWNLFEGPIAPSSGDGGAPVILSAHGLVYAGPGDSAGNTLFFTSDPARAKSSWQAILNYNQSGPFDAVNRNGKYIAADGTVYLPGGNAIVYTSPGPRFGQSWQIVSGTSAGSTLSGDGRSAAQGGQLFASIRTSPTNEVYSGPLPGLSPFAPFNTSPSFISGASLAYDVTRHILYATAGSQGLRRGVTY